MYQEIKKKKLSFSLNDYRDFVTFDGAIKS